MVTTDGRSASQHRELRSSKGERVYSGKLAVLIDEWTYGGGEALAGALKDNNRALLFGNKTFGGGRMRTTIPFDDGSAVEFSTAEMMTPKGHKIRRKWPRAGCACRGKHRAATHRADG